MHILQTERNLSNFDPFAVIDHRPWPLPRGSWLMFQRWLDLLFAHWPIPAEEIAPLIPPGLTLETYAGTAWLGIVPFRMSHVRPRGLPAVPWLSYFPELNVRTYVRVDDRPGVFFFSLDAGNPVAVALARTFFHLPYFRADMDLRHGDGEGDAETIHYTSRRTHGGAPNASFVARYRPLGPIYRAAAGSFEYWLTERYALYSADRRGHIYRGEIHHQPWPLQPAEAEFTFNSVAEASGLSLPDQAPLLHFVRRLDVVAWAVQPVSAP
jgi:uncharacterized protein